MTENPYLDPSYNIQWSKLTAAEVASGIEEAIQRGTTALRTIMDIADGAETFANTFLALEEATLKVSQPWGKVSHLTSVNDHPELRAAHKSMLPAISTFFASIPLDQQLYRKLKHFADSPAAQSLDRIESRFVRETIKDFEDAGANLDDPTRARLREIETLLAEKTKTYSDHVLDATNAYEKIIDSADALAGLPESLIEAARADALAKGIGTDEAPKYRLTLQAPSFVPALRFLDSDDIRKELTDAWSQVGHAGDYENEPLVREILALRKEKATLLGKRNFPDWVLSRRMSGSGQRALEFVEDLQGKTKEAFDREYEELMAFKAAKTGTEPDLLNPWEIGYWSEKLRQERFDFDEEALRPYLPMESVMSGMFKLVEALFDIRVEEVVSPKPDGWHPEVQLYAIYDIPSGRHMGSFYTDWFPREPKRGGAWMNHLITGKPQENGELSPHLGLVVGNLMPPVGDKPSLLTHRDVETIFHEFGHLLHHVLSEVKIRSLAGTNVAWDFVELPSQIMENWCWERESLDLFARHYETGEPIPEDLFQKMKAARTFGAARMQMRQLTFGKMDLSLHMDFDPEGDNDIDAFIEAALVGYNPKLKFTYPSNVRNFGHIFSDATGYAAGYYSYKWAEVLDADAFTRFTKDGIMNKSTGKAFREAVLAKGNSAEANTLFHAFMGREPDASALLKRLGLLAVG